MTEEPLRRFATNVTAGVTDPAVVDALARVPRALFVRTLVDRDGRPVPATHDKIYSDEALVTRVRDGLPSSSSSQPSLMAQMLATLRLRPGHRVLEIGAGTGWNAALIATITGGPVVSVDVQPDVVAEAVAAIAGSGVAGVTVLAGDGYLGAPGHGPFDRIIATVGVGGIPPAWLEQLAPDGLVLAPVEHGGIQPCLAVTPAPAGPTGRGALRSGFMLAAGRLHPSATAPAPLELPADVVPVPMPPVPARLYYELWFGLAAMDARVERRVVPGLDVSGSMPCVVTDPADGSVIVGLDALYPVGASPALVKHVATLVARWREAGAPRVDAWRCRLMPDEGLWRPAAWHLA